MGLTFKENCPDLRNTRVIDIVNELEQYNCYVDVFDPWVNVEEAQCEYGVLPIQELQKNRYDAILLAVAHDEFKELGSEKIREYGKKNHLLYDLKYLFSAEQSDLRL